MADTILLRSTLRLLLLLTVAVLAAVGSSNEQASLDVSTQSFSTTPKSANITLNLTGTKEKEREHLSPKVPGAENVKAKDVSWDEDSENEEEEEAEEDGEDEGEDEETDESDTEVDEYEDELREIAESHEAMAKDQRGNGILNTTNSTNSVSKNQSFPSTSFASPEKNDGITSDESSGSKGPFVDDDEEVAELLRYKQKATSMLEEKLLGGNSELGTKVKRVPTVKKELSSQKEIFNANETQLPLPKTLASNVDILNRLDDDTRTETRYELPIFSRDVARYEPLVRDDTSFEEEYSEGEAPGDLLRKVDKRQPSKLNDLRSYFLDGYNSEQEQRRKLQELGIEEGAMAESLMELLSRLAEDPRLWERVHRILTDVVGLSPQTEYLVDSQKRAYSSDSLLQIPMTMDGSEAPGTPSTTKKPKKKKKKKKKKKLRQRMTTTTTPTSNSVTTTAMPPSPVPLFVPTTSPNWPATTQAQWRLVAERLFAAPWSEEHHETPPSTNKMRLVKEGLPSINDKQRVSLKTLNDERQALMLQSAREYSQPRRLHYGKVNTHEKGSPNSQESEISANNYNAEMNNPMIDYNLNGGRSYEQRPIPVDPYNRYGNYARQRIRYYNLSPVDREQRNDYDEVFRAPEDAANHRPFARTQQFRPLGRDYASTKTWQDSRYDYTRPWKDKARPDLDTIIGSGGNWPWRSSQRDYKIWSPRYQQAWPRDRNYWQRVGNVEEQLEEIMSDDGNENDVPPVNRQRQQQHRQPNWHVRHEDPGRWPVNRNLDVPSWQLHDRPKSHSRGNLPVSLEKSKNRSELNNKDAIVKPAIKDNAALPKITMKTWNSLTSDPATWPFKLNGAKPWPKDKNGNSYNPNAELVRKLGLDKQDRLLSPSKEINGINKEILPEDSVKNKMPESTEIEAENRNELDSGPNAIKSPISWSEKLGGIDEWKSRQENDRAPQRDDEGRQSWQTNLDNEDRKLWPGQSAISPKISSVGAWVMPADQSTWRPYDLKHKVYGQLSDEQRWNGATNSEENEARSWPSSNKVASGSWPQKPEDWNVVGSVYVPEKSAPAGHSSTWPSKWRQFAYHKVTAAPATKSGALNVVEGSSRPRNSYIAVSAVSPPKYPNNEWRKNDIEETQLDRNSGDNMSIDQDDPTSQLRKNSAVTNERWNDKSSMGHVKESELDRNRNDPLEHQLEELRRGPYWNHEQLLSQNQKRSDLNGNSSITFVTSEAPRVVVESSSVDNEILKNRAASMTIPESQTQGKKNVTQ